MRVSGLTMFVRNFRLPKAQGLSSELMMKAGVDS